MRTLRRMVLRLCDTMQFFHSGSEIVDQRMLPIFRQRLRDRSIVPEGPISPAGETHPYFIAQQRAVANRRADVVQLVRCDDKFHFGIGFAHGGDEPFLSFAPLWFGFHEGVRARFNQLRYSRAKLRADALQGCVSIAVFDGIMQKCSDECIFIATMFADNCGDCHHVRDVRHAGSFACVLGVNFLREGECINDAACEYQFASLDSMRVLAEGGGLLSHDFQYCSTIIDFKIKALEICYRDGL